MSLLLFGLGVRGKVRVEKYGRINFVFLCCSHDGELKSSRRVRCSVSLRASLELSFDVGVAPLLAESLGSNLSGSSDHTTSRQGTSSMVLEKWVQYYRYCSPFTMESTGFPDVASADYSIQRYGYCA